MISVKHGEDNKGNDRVNAVDFVPARSAKAQDPWDDKYGDDDEDAEDADTDEDEGDDEPPF